MIRPARDAILSIMLASLLSIGGTRTAIGGSNLPDPATAGLAEQLYRLDCGHSLANDESVWTPGKNVGRSIEFSSTCWLIKAASIASMEKIKRMIGTYHATLFINHDKAQADTLKLLPAFYD
jgi:hypothetical protein